MSNPKYFDRTNVYKSTTTEITPQVRVKITDPRATIYGESALGAIGTLSAVVIRPSYGDDPWYIVQIDKHPWPLRPFKEDEFELA